jgi:hypothetical protein
VRRATHGIVTLSLEEFTYGFVNTFGPEEAAGALAREDGLPRVRGSASPVHRGRGLRRGRGSDRELARRGPRCSGRRANEQRDRMTRTLRAAGPDRS